MKNYASLINGQLRPASRGEFFAVDLFAGCGGLALGFEASGISTVGYEMDRHACATYRKNLGSQCHEVKLTPDTQLPSCDVLIGGPPCQPFSVGGHQKGLEDSRDGFPVFISAVRRLQPPVWMFENVRGMMYGNRWYLDQIIGELEALDYVVETRLVNAVHYDVPQKRERLVVVGHRGGFAFPCPGSRVWTAGQALDGILYQDHPDSKFLTASMDRYVANYEKASCCVKPRDLHLDLPARTLTCRNLAGATGDMQRIRFPDGRRRRLLVREAARLQSFPDFYEFCGPELSVFKQIGNAVPPMLAHAMAQAILAHLRKIGQRPSNRRMEATA